jgi:hypothetical protein
LPFDELFMRSPVGLDEYMVDMRGADLSFEPIRKSISCFDFRASGRMVLVGLIKIGGETTGFR